MSDIKEEKRFAEYVSHYNPEDSQIRLKVVHTWKVVQAADQIAASLGLSTDQKRLVHLAALFHDIGRFEQVRRYHTFHDAKSVDHAALGAEILKQEDFLKDLSQDQQAQVIEAVRIHSQYAIPQEDKGFQRVLDQIIRDADKIDIFRVAATESPKDTSGATLETIDQDRISPLVYQAVMEERSVLRSDRRSHLDFWISFLGFVSDLNYPASANLVLEQNDWQKPLKEMLTSYQITDPATRSQIEDLLAKTKTVLEQKSKNPVQSISTES
ncbi:HD domain-containing protein [Erysipelotrichaceae bacterium RD49]|nr:HD domain-containing protein [Erysipelotrichaceae bacterium RD49]